MFSRQLIGLLSGLLVAALFYSGSMCAVVPAANLNKQALTIEQFIQKAEVYSPQLKGIRAKQLAAKSEAQASNTMPDPSINLAFANLPVGSFDFAQEPMTQFQVGISQSFNRGDTATLESQGWQQSAQLSAVESQLYQAQLRKSVSHTWLDLVRTSKRRALVEQSLTLLEQVMQIASANYSSAVGSTRQSDVIRAQLEVTRFQEELMLLQQQEADYINQLSGWIGTRHWLPLISDESLNITVIKPEWLKSNESSERKIQIDGSSDSLNKGFQLWSQRLLNHPEVKLFAQKIEQAKTREAIVEQSYKPQWKMNASYGYREDAPTGMQRDDFFSVGVSFDLPLFTSNKQDKKAIAASYHTQTSKYEKQEKLTRLFSQVFTVKQNIKNLMTREAYFSERLLLQAEEQAEAALTAYTNDDGDFTEVVRARLDVLSLSLQQLEIVISRKKQLINWNYLFSHFISSGVNSIEQSRIELSNEEQS